MQVFVCICEHLHRQGCRSVHMCVVCLCVFTYIYCCARASLVAQMVKRLPAMKETWVRSLGWEDPLEKEMATYSSIIAWKIPWTARLQFMGSQRVVHK